MGNLLVFQFRRFAITAWIILVLAIVVVIWRQENVSHRAHELAVQNTQRIADIQQSRVESCQRIYDSFHQVFDPFLAPPAKRTKAQQKQIKKFNDILSEQKSRCDIYVKH